MSSAAMAVILSARRGASPWQACIALITDANI